MNFVVLGRDPPGGGSRPQHRADHLGYVEGRQDLILYAGPLLEDGRMIGSIFVFDVPDRAALDAYLDGDPYFNPGIFETVEIWESRRMVPEQEPGFLAAEAERARG
ncbi:MAG: YciI family protein [Allosphingosinicella sp.]